MIEINELNDEDFSLLQELLDKNKGISDSEYKNLSIRHPYAFTKYDNPNLIISSMKHYGLHCEQLNTFLISNFGTPEYKIDFFYELTYNEGDYTNPHYDIDISIQTTLVLLNDDFIGGELFIDETDVKFNKKKSYINFNGHKLKHSINKVLSGKRIVLVIMFNKKQTLI
jgi:hypothetical protein